jgi:hypothetical protein
MKIAKPMIRVNPRAEAYIKNSKSGIISRRTRHRRPIRGSVAHSGIWGAGNRTVASLLNGGASWVQSGSDYGLGPQLEILIMRPNFCVCSVLDSLGIGRYKPERCARLAKVDGIAEERSRLRVKVGLLVQDNTQEGIVDLDLAVVVLDEAQLPEFVHEEIDSRARGADHLGQNLMTYHGNFGDW